MKKIFNMLLSAAAVIGLSTSCADIPAPYDIFGDGTFTGKSLPYKSANMNTGWETRSVTTDEPWSKGSNYVQATGYQAWDGASSKSNKEVESYLVSPAFNTTTECGKVKFSFDYTIKYTNNVSGWQNNHKIYITKEYKENEEWNPDVWEEIEWTPVASPYSDWTLYTSGEIQLPEKYTNAEDVRFAFYFYAPATASTTWELMNFLLEEGEATASDTPEDNNGTLPYTSSNLNSGWNNHSITTEEPWSKGSNYTQATGYQKWDGAEQKSNKEVESYLISPAINTTCESGKVKFSFDNTIRYTNNVSGWQKYHKIYITKEYKENEEWNPDVWEEIEWTPTASTYSDWTLYSSGDIQVPEEFVNQKEVHIAFYFYAPANASTTWELQNFKMEEGEANGSTPDTPTDAIDITCAKAVELCAALADGGTSDETYSVTGYITDVFANISNNQQSFWMADTKDGGKVLQAYWANLPQGVSAFKVGSKVKITGKLLKYVKNGEVTTEIKNANVVILEEGDGGGNGNTTTGTEINCAKAAELCNALADGGTSSETYSVTGYITDVFANVSNNQQSFWMADTKDGGKVLQAYWANLPQGVSAFKLGSKVKITGKLLKYVKNGEVTPEIKNANVVILEEGDGTGGGDNGNNGTTAQDENISISDNVVTLSNPSVTPQRDKTEVITFTGYGFTNGQDLTDQRVTADGCTITFGKGTAEKNTPKYYDASTGPRIYPGNTMTITGTNAPIATVVIECDVYQGTNCVGQATATVTSSGNTMTYTNAGTGTGTATQLRPKKMTVTYGPQNGSGVRAQRFAKHK